MIVSLKVDVSFLEMFPVILKTDCCLLTQPPSISAACLTLAARRKPHAALASPNPKSQFPLDPVAGIQVC